MPFFKSAFFMERRVKIDNKKGFYVKCWGVLKLVIKISTSFLTKGVDWMSRSVYLAYDIIWYLFINHGAGER